MNSLFKRALGATVLSMAVVLPSMGVSAGGTTIRKQSARPQSVLTGTTCNGNTCQVVTGSGTKVTSWYTQTTAPAAVCTFAKYLENGTVIAESSETCLKAGEEASATWNSPGSFPAGTTLCTTWTGISGKPCDTIE